MSPILNKPNVIYNKRESSIKSQSLVSSPIKVLEEILNQLVEKDLIQHVDHPHLETYMNGAKNRRQKIMNWKYAISMRCVDGLDGLLGSLEYARILIQSKEEGKLCKVPTEDYIRTLANHLKHFVPHNIDTIEYLKKIQEFYDKAYGNLRIFVYSPSESYKNARFFYTEFDQKYEHNLCIYIDENGKYFVITDIGRFLNDKASKNNNYCWECNSYYRNKILNEHKQSCPIRCPACYRIDPKNGRCKKECDVHCPICNKNFFNDDCFNYHLETKQCGKVFRCKDCNKNINMDGFRKNTIKFFGRIHECGEKLCCKKNCWTYHHPMKPHITRKSTST